MLLTVLLCVATFAAAAAGDYLETVYVQRVTEARAHPAARASVAMYLVGFAGWVITVKVSLFYAVPEVVGLYLGTLLAVRRQRRQACVASGTQLSCNVHEQRGQARTEAGGGACVVCGEQGACSPARQSMASSTPRAPS